MTEKEFSKLSRKELLKLLLTQAREQNQMEEQMAKVTEQVLALERGRECLEQNLNAKNGQLADLERYLGEKDNQIEELKRCIDEKDGQIESLTGNLEEKNVQIEKMKSSISDKDEQIEQLASSIVDKDKLIEKMEDYLLRKDEQVKECKDRLKDKDGEIKELKDTLENEREVREIRIRESGSIAEAALKLNDVFEAAQKAADQYVENIVMRAQKYDFGLESLLYKTASEEKIERKEPKTAEPTPTSTLRNESRKGFEVLRQGVSDIRRSTGKDVRKKAR